MISYAYLKTEGTYFKALIAFSTSVANENQETGLKAR